VPKNVFVGPPLQKWYVEAAVTPATPKISISTLSRQKNQIEPLLQYIFLPKKFKFQNSNLIRTYIRIYNSNIVSTSTIILYKLTLQVQFTRTCIIHRYIDIIHKSNPFHNSKPFDKVRPISYSIHIVINSLELAFSSHEDVGTEDAFLTRIFGHDNCLFVWVSSHSFLFLPL
jgi:hypothetical protein